MEKGQMVREYRNVREMTIKLGNPDIYSHPFIRSIDYLFHSRFKAAVISHCASRAS